MIWHLYFMWPLADGYLAEWHGYERTKDKKYKLAEKMFLESPL